MCGVPFLRREAVITSHTERCCTTSAAFPTEHQPSSPCELQLKSQVANTTTTVFGPSSSRPTFFSHERDKILLLHLDLSARRRPVQLLLLIIIAHLPCLSYSTSSCTALSSLLFPAILPAEKSQGYPNGYRNKSGQDPSRSYCVLYFIL